MIISKKYITEVKGNSKLSVNMIKKDLALSYILQELDFENLVFKGGTLLSKGHLNYHRLSEDLDFTYLMPEFDSKTKKIKFIKEFVKIKFIPKLLEIAQKYGFDFENDIESNSSNRYCPVKQSDFLFRFNIYLSKEEINPIKIEINFLDKCIFVPKIVKIRHLNSQSKNLVYPLKDISILSYSIEEIILEKIRAILTRDKIHERDFFDLFLINKEFEGVFEFEAENLFQKLKDSRLFQIDKKKFFDLVDSFENRFNFISNFLFSEIEEMVLIEFNRKDYERFVLNLYKKILSLNFNCSNRLK